MAVEYFRASEDIHDTMRDLVEKNHPDLFILQDEIIILFRNQASKVGGQKQMGKASLVSAKTRAYAREDYRIELELAQDVWETLSSVQQEALLDHLLTSCQCTEDPKSGELKVRIVRPDIMAFSENLERYGAWFPSGREEGALRFQVIRDEPQGEAA